MTVTVTCSEPFRKGRTALRTYSTTTIRRAGSLVLPERTAGGLRVSSTTTAAERPESFDPQTLTWAMIHWVFLSTETALISSLFLREADGRSLRSTKAISRLNREYMDPMESS